MLIALVAALAPNGVIGSAGQLPWVTHYPEDMRWFRAITCGKTVIMGRKTFTDCVKRPLQDRENIVISRRSGEECANMPFHGQPNVQYVSGMAAALKAAGYQADAAVGEKLRQLLPVSGVEQESVTQEARYDAIRQLPQVCVIGGGEIFRAVFSQADLCYITRVHKPYEGDVYFPELSDEWREVYSHSTYTQGTYTQAIGERDLTFQILARL